MVPDINKLEKIVQDVLGDRSCFTKDHKISPFLNPPYDNIHPGVMSNALFKFHELYPEIFPYRTSFMGNQPYHNFADEINQKVWTEEFDCVFYQEGHFDSEGNFRAPITAYRVKMQPGTDLRQQVYILFQQGSYQILEEHNGEHIEKGKLVVSRGIGNATQFFVPEIGSERYEKYMEYLAFSFASPLLSLSYNDVSRAESDHMRIDPIECIPLTLIDRYDYEDLQQSYSTSGGSRIRKFGPNFVSFETPLDNLRIMTEWTGEGEVYILDHKRAVRVK